MRAFGRDLADLFVHRRRIVAEFGHPAEHGDAPRGFFVSERGQGRERPRERRVVRVEDQAHAALEFEHLVPAPRQRKMRAGCGERGRRCAAQLSSGKGGGEVASIVIAGERDA